MKKTEGRKEGYTLCECGEGILLHEAGYEVELHMCAVCRRMVADPADFDKEKVNDNYRL